MKQKIVGNRQKRYIVSMTMLGAEVGIVSFGARVTLPDEGPGIRFTAGVVFLHNR